MEKEILLQRFDELCKSLNAADKVGIIHHGDADGFCSGLIAAKAIERLTGKKPVVVRHYEYGNKRREGALQPP